MINQSNRRILEKIQDQCVSIINPRLSINEVYKTHNLLKLQDLIELSNLEFGHRFEQESLPIKIMESIKYDHKKNSLIKIINTKPITRTSRTCHRPHINCTEVVTYIKAYYNIQNYHLPLNK